MTVTSLRLIIQSLNDADVRYLVIGGLALAAHGYLRCTIDLDLLIQLKSSNVLRAVNCLRSLGYISKSAAPLEGFAHPDVRRQLVAQGQRVLRLKSPMHDETPIDLLTEELLDFESSFAHRLSMELEQNLTLPVCAYEDLVTLKRLANRSIDPCDLQQLEKARSLPTTPEAEDPWASCTFEGAELATLRNSAALPFHSKVAQLEEMHKIGRIFQEQRHKWGRYNSTIRASGLREDI